MGHYMRSVLEREAKRLKEEAMGDRYVVRDKDGDLWAATDRTRVPSSFADVESFDNTPAKARDVSMSRSVAEGVRYICKTNSAYGPLKLYRLIPKRKPKAERDRAVELLRRVVDLVDDRYVDSTAFAGVVAMIASDARAFLASLDKADQ